MSTSKAVQPETTRTRKKAAPSAAEPAPRPERFVVLLRHGIAQDLAPDGKDEERGLTADGHARMKQIARGLERVLPKAQAIYASPLLRAVQTALWVAKGYRLRIAVTTTDALAPGASPRQFLDLVASMEVRRAIFIGHEPNLTASLRALTGLPAAPSFDLKKGGCYGVRLTPDGVGVLEWILPPRVLRELGG